MVRLKWFEATNIDGEGHVMGFVGKVQFFIITRGHGRSETFDLTPEFPVAWEVDDFEAHSDGYTIEEAKVEARRMLKSWLTRAGLEGRKV